MARIRLASRYDGSAPGDVVEVPAELVRPLTRDGRVAEVLPDSEPDPAPETVESAADPEPPSEPPQTGRRSRRSST